MEARDIKKARAHLLYKQYEGRKPVDVSRFKHVTVKTMVDLVEGAWKEIARELGLT